MIKIIIPIEPVEQARPRAVRMRRGVRLYDPAKVRNYKSELALRARKKYPVEPLDGQLSVKVKFYRRNQKGVSKKRLKLREEGKIRSTKKPDASNYLKSFEDALNGVLWKDDAMIVHEEIDKYYSEFPRIEFEVEKIGESLD